MSFINNICYNDVTFILGQANCGQKKRGTEMGPKAVISESFLNNLFNKNVKVKIIEVEQASEGDIEYFKNKDNYLKNPCLSHLYQPLIVAETCRRVHNAVATSLGVEKITNSSEKDKCTHNSLQMDSNKTFPIMVGGDHSLAIGSISAVVKKYPNVRVIWFDAHPDINVPASSSSGNMHGMPLSILTGITADKDFAAMFNKNLKNSKENDYSTTPPGMENGLFNCIPIDRVGYIGIRDIDEGESVAIKKYKMIDDCLDKKYNVIYGGEMGEKGENNYEEKVKYGDVVALTRVLLKKLSMDENGNKYPIHLSLDVDGIDPTFMPSTGTPVPKGVSLDDAVEIIKLVRQSNCLVSMDLVEVNPLIGSEEDVEKTVRNSQRLIETAIFC